MAIETNTSVEYIKIGEEAPPKQSVYQRVFDQGAFEFEVQQLPPVLRNTIDILLEKGVLVKESHFGSEEECFLLFIKPRTISIVDL